MTKKKTEEEKLLDLVKTQRSTIKNLRKQLNRQDKRKHQYEDLEDRQAEVSLEEEKKELNLSTSDRCPVCSGKIRSADVIKRIILTCESCDYRKVIKK